jgi:hypothetical protein
MAGQGGDVGPSNVNIIGEVEVATQTALYTQITSPLIHPIYQHGGPQ